MNRYLIRHCEETLLRGPAFPSLREELRSNKGEARKKKNSDLQNFFNYFSGLQQCFAPRNDDSGIHAATPIYSRNPVKNTNKISIFSCFSGLLILVRNNIK